MKPGLRLVCRSASPVIFTSQSAASVAVPFLFAASAYMKMVKQCYWPTVQILFAFFLCLDFKHQGSCSLLVADGVRRCGQITGPASCLRSSPSMMPLETCECVRACVGGEGVLHLAHTYKTRCRYIHTLYYISCCWRPANACKFRKVGGEGLLTCSCIMYVHAWVGVSKCKRGRGKGFYTLLVQRALAARALRVRTQKKFSKLLHALCTCCFGMVRCYW